MSYHRDRQAHLSGVGVIAAATPAQVARSRRARAAKAVRMVNHDQMLVRLANGRVALGTLPTKYQDGGVTGHGTNAGGGAGGSPVKPIYGGRGTLVPFRAPMQTLPGPVKLRPPLTDGGIPVPQFPITSVYPQPGSVTDGTGQGASAGSPLPGGSDAGGGAASGSPDPSGIPVPDGMQTDPGDTVPTEVSTTTPSLTSSLMDQWNNLSSTGKIAVAGGAAAILYFVFLRRRGGP